jgi:hypothetical protein
MRRGIQLRMCDGHTLGLWTPDVDWDDKMFFPHFVHRPGFSHTGGLNNGSIMCVDRATGRMGFVMFFDVIPECISGTANKRLRPGKFSRYRICEQCATGYISTTNPQRMLGWAPPATTSMTLESDVHRWEQKVVLAREFLQIIVSTPRLARSLPETHPIVALP